ncbi:MAG: DNA processing protein DprA, partial [Pseudonocardia sp.]|nr:DNA processing protein DprA [Pseudonocardia sp.]
APSAPMRASDVLSGPTLRVHESLSRQARDPRRLSVESGLPVELVRAALPELERLGMAERLDGGWRRRRHCPEDGRRGDA